MQLEIGDVFSSTREVTDELVRAFAEISGDFNPIHIDEEFARSTRFGQRIAHGMLSGALISAVLGNEFREHSTLYLSQTMKFTTPVFIGDTVITTVTVSSLRKDKPIVTFATTCAKQTGEVTLQGEAVVMFLS